MKVKVKDISFDVALKCKSDTMSPFFYEKSKERWDKYFKGKEAEISELKADDTFKCGNAIYRIRVSGFPSTVRMCSDMLEMD